MDKLEKIERLRERAQVSYDEAREAYEQADGDLLDALILLEKQGKDRPPQGDGYYRSEQTVHEPSGEGQGERSEGRQGKNEQETNNFKETLDRIVVPEVDRGNNTSFEILKIKNIWPVSCDRIGVCFSCTPSYPALDCYWLVLRFPLPICEQRQRLERKGALHETKILIIEDEESLPVLWRWNSPTKAMR